MRQATTRSTQRRHPACVAAGCTDVGSCATLLLQEHNLRRCGPPFHPLGRTAGTPSGSLIPVQHAIRRPYTPLHGEPDVHLAVRRSPGLPDSFPSGEEFQSCEEHSVCRASGIDSRRRPLRDDAVMDVTLQHHRLQRSKLLPELV